MTDAHVPRRPWKKQQQQIQALLATVMIIKCVLPPLYLRRCKEACFCAKYNRKEAAFLLGKSKELQQRCESFKTILFHSFAAAHHLIKKLFFKKQQSTENFA